MQYFIYVRAYVHVPIGSMHPKSILSDRYLSFTSQESYAEYQYPCNYEYAHSEYDLHLDARKS